MARRTFPVAWGLVAVLVGVVLGRIISVIVYGRQTGRFMFEFMWQEGHREWGIRGYVTQPVPGPHDPQQQLIGTIYGLGPAALEVRSHRPVLIVRGWDQNGDPITDRVPE
jgi:hypothetical protein